MQNVFEWGIRPLLVIVSIKGFTVPLPSVVKLGLIILSYQRGQAADYQTGRWNISTKFQATCCTIEQLFGTDAYTFSHIGYCSIDKVYYLYFLKYLCI